MKARCCGWWFIEMSDSQPPTLETMCDKSNVQRMPLFYDLNINNVQNFHHHRKRNDWQHIVTYIYIYMQQKRKDRIYLKIILDTHSTEWCGCFEIGPVKVWWIISWKEFPEHFYSSFSYTLSIRYALNWDVFYCTWALFQYKIRFGRYRMPTMNLRRSWNRLIF